MMSSSRDEISISPDDKGQRSKAKTEVPEVRVEVQDGGRTIFGFTLRINGLRRGCHRSNVIVKLRNPG